MKLVMPKWAQSWKGSDPNRLMSSKHLVSPCCAGLKWKNGRLAAPEDGIAPHRQVCSVFPQRPSGPWPRTTKKGFAVESAGICVLVGESGSHRIQSFKCECHWALIARCLLVFQPITVWMALALHSLSSAFFSPFICQVQGALLLVCSKSINKYSQEIEWTTPKAMVCFLSAAPEL